MRVGAITAFLIVLFVLGARTLSAQPAPSSAGPAVPRLVRVAGTFTPANHMPTAPVETVTLAIYAEETGGTPLWQETQYVAVDADGRYTVLLGATRPDGLPLDLFASGDARWLGRRFERPEEAEQARVLLASVPYALKASDADTLGGRPPSAYLLADPGASGAAGSIGASRIGGGATTATATTSSALGVSALTAGTTNYVGKFVNATDLGISALYESGGRVGVNTTGPFDVVHVSFLDTTGELTGYAVQNLGTGAASYSGMLFYDQNGALGQFQGFNNSTHEYRVNNIATGGTINFMIGGGSKFLVANNGSIGIGTSTPTRARLEVVGAITNQPNPGAVGLFNSSGVSSVSAGTDAISIYATNDIFSPAFVAFSDARIKNVEGRSDGTHDLQTLAGIEVSDYTFIDTATHGTGKQKKVIAQQLETVYPQAVRRSTDVVPDVYQKAPIRDGWIMLATDLKPGERVRLIGREKEGIYDVLEIAEGKFRTAFTENDDDHVFVYGREVNDFRSVDYEAVAMLNVSATQELNRRLEAQASEIAMLKQAIADLQAAVVRIESVPKSTR